MVSTHVLAWTYCFHHLMACVDRTKMFLQNIHYHVCTTRLYGVLTQTTLWILTTVITSNPIPKIIKNWNVDGKVTWGKIELQNSSIYYHIVFNPLTPNDHYSDRTALLTSKRYILYIYSTNIGTEYFKHGIYSSFFFLQNAICFIILTYLVPVLFTFYIQGVLK